MHCDVDPECCRVRAWTLNAKAAQASVVRIAVEKMCLPSPPAVDSHQIPSNLSLCDIPYWVGPCCHSGRHCLQQ